MFHRLRSNRASLAALAALLVGILGLVVQWIADPSKFGDAEQSFGITFPPGIIFILVAAVLMVLTSRWWWHPVFAAIACLWIVGAGSLADQLQPNLTSHNAGTVAGNVVMAGGLIVALVAGVVSAVGTLRSRRTRGARAEAPRAEASRS
ncbi:hypothetical protein Athai_59720 [Actinocatenispora thailandica]|uniref:Uncharacterized protein n=1 Tax=Actinocatenispora thailandica TaxID=227318 RepID=A0A7R7DV77_9ACTN|nr:hypothetical protein [Actinocatenispora thailandica]BCJ38469.1 hypothetical protein Athai_59720 [Actinocatenispora thailandica]